MCTIRRKYKGGKKAIAFFATTSLVAALSLVTFFVPRENAPGRLGVLVTLYLLLINLYRSMEVPTKIGFGYIDQWFITIQVPVLVSVIEFTLRFIDMSEHVVIGWIVALIMAVNGN